MTDSSQVNEFIKAQIVEWPIAAGNFAALTNVRIKEFDVDGMRIKVQFNPARIVSSAAKSLKFGGKLCMAHIPDRLPEIFVTMKKYNLEPKRLNLVKGGGKIYLALVEAVKGGKAGLNVGISENK